MMIAIEGCDAAGKATHSKLLAEKLAGEVVSFPDYTTPAGQAILGNLKGEWASRITSGNGAGMAEVRELAETQLNAMVLQSLMTINRFELMPRIADLRMRGRNVVFDRYYASALVYGSLDGLDPEWVARIQAPLPEPDLWMLIDVPPEESVKRRPERRDRYEKMPGFMEHVRKAYLLLFERRGWPVVDGMGTVTEVQARIWKLVEPHVTGAPPNGG